MEGLFILGSIIGVLGLFGGLAIRLGVDSRLESVDPRSPAGGIQAY